MAEALQHRQAALIARISTACTTGHEPIPDTARSGRKNAIISPSRWYKKSVRPSFRSGGRHHSGTPGGFIPFYPGDFAESARLPRSRATIPAWGRTVQSQLDIRIPPPSLSQTIRIGGYLTTQKVGTVRTSSDVIWAAVVMPRNKFVWSSIAWFSFWILLLVLDDPIAKDRQPDGWMTDARTWLFAVSFPIQWFIIYFLFALYAVLVSLDVQLGIFKAAQPEIFKFGVGAFDVGWLEVIFVAWLQWFIIVPWLVRTFRNRQRAKTE